MDDPFQLPEWQVLLDRHRDALQALQGHYGRQNDQQMSGDTRLVDEFEAANAAIREYVLKATGRSFGS